MSDSISIAIAIAIAIAISVFFMALGPLNTVQIRHFHPEPESLAQRRRGAVAFSTWLRQWVDSMLKSLPWEN
ncbi:MAG TPA: hypothetical protein DEW46_03560, partial [Verrucomicrobia bacterium]|nr:hypothetical protein [Verrucomicrobiota bacterium]